MKLSRSVSRVDRLERLAGVLGQDLVQALRAVARISRAWISMSVAWPWKPPEGWWIMIREFGSAVALALGAGGQQQRAHRGRLADADRRDVGLDVLHGVVDRQAGGDDAARAS